MIALVIFDRYISKTKQKYPPLYPSVCEVMLQQWLNNFSKLQGWQLITRLVTTTGKQSILNRFEFDINKFKS